MSDALFDSAIAGQLHRDLLVKRVTASDSTEVLGDLGKALGFGEPLKSASNGLFVHPR
jgi:hypothetical protein